MQTRAFIIACLLLVGCSSSRDGSPADEHTPKQEAQDFIASGQFQEAIDVLLPLSTENPKDSQVQSMLGEAYWRRGIYDQAVTSFENSLRLFYGDGMTHRMFGQMLMEMGKVGRALTEFQLAVEFDSGDALSHYNYGLALYEFGRADDALVQWETAFSLDPSSATYAEAVGIALTGKDDTAALGYFEEANTLGGSGPSFHNNYGLLLLRLSRFTEAASHFDEALRADPSNDAFRLNLAVARLKAKDYASAVPVLEELVSRSPENPTYRVYLGRAYYEQGQFATAIEVLEKQWGSGTESVAETSDTGSTAERGQASPGEAYDTLAMSYRGLKRLDEAVVYAAKAVNLEPTNVAHLNNYGVILAENGRIKDAKAQWRKALSLDPGNAVAKQNLSAVGE